MIQENLFLLISWNHRKTGSFFNHKSLRQPSSTFFKLLFASLRAALRPFAPLRVLSLPCLRFPCLRFPSIRFPSLRFPLLPFASLPFPSLPFASLPFPSLPFPSLPFPSLPFPAIRFGSLRFPSLPFPSLPSPSSTFFNLPQPSILEVLTPIDRQFETPRKPPNPERRSRSAN